MPKHPCRSVPSTFEKHGISPSGIEGAATSSAAAATTAIPGIFPISLPIGRTDEQDGTLWERHLPLSRLTRSPFPSSTGGLSNSPHPSPHFGSGGVHGADLDAEFRLDQDGCGEQGVSLDPLTPCQPRHWRIGVRHCPCLAQRIDLPPPSPPGYVRTPEQRCPRAVDTIRHAAASSQR